ncbi:hypothetical protein [Massilia sp. BJB1822]|uniref:hypothetical protein n=1 Tax=Massilia sp. BJB1822 TaxID=2744470 RepID=UPI00159386D6|nr:hypothetical protein [Massilia sp. BJB1822]NVE00702.1 hypothetical protein [Massilia sp. BJB1822]
MMVILTNLATQPVHTIGATYTVIARSGQRGTEYDDPRQAAMAFYEACAEDHPFVLRNHANISCVVAVTRAGKKAVVPSGKSSSDFQSAYEILRNQEAEICPTSEVGDPSYTLPTHLLRCQRQDTGR